MYSFEPAVVRQRAKELWQDEKNKYKGLPLAQLSNGSYNSSSNKEFNLNTHKLEPAVVHLLKNYGKSLTKASRHIGITMNNRGDMLEQKMKGVTADGVRSNIPKRATKTDYTPSYAVTHRPLLSKMQKMHKFEGRRYLGRTAGGQDVWVNCN